MDKQPGNYAGPHSEGPVPSNTPARACPPSLGCTTETVPAAQHTHRLNGTAPSSVGSTVSSQS